MRKRYRGRKRGSSATSLGSPRPTELSEHNFALCIVSDLGPACCRSRMLRVTLCVIMLLGTAGVDSVYFDARDTMSENGLDGAPSSIICMQSILYLDRMSVLAASRGGGAYCI